MPTCRACGVDPLTWLRDVLTGLPQRGEEADVGDLLPFNFSKTSAARQSRVSLPVRVRFSGAAAVNAAWKIALTIGSQRLLFILISKGREADAGDLIGPEPSEHLPD